MWHRASGFLAAIAVFLLAGSAWAQAAHERIDSARIGNALDAPNQDPDRRVHVANLRDCRDLVGGNEELTLTWTFRSTPPTGSEYGVKVQRGSENCELGSPVAEDADDCPLLRSRRDFSGRTINESFRARTVFGFDDPAECDGRTLNHDISLIFTRRSVAGEAEPETGWSFDQVRLRLITSRPSPPSEVETLAGENTIEVRWNAPDDQDEFVVYYAETPFSIAEAPEDLSGVRRQRATGSRVALTSGVSVDREYWIAVTTLDENGNESLFSEQVTAETRPVEDFWRRYRSAGGQEEGGYCAAAGGGTGTVWLLALALLVRRRRREVSHG